MANKQIFRADWHDYRERCIYMVTLAKSPAAPIFGSLAGSTAIPVGEPGSTFVSLSPIGRYLRNALMSISSIEPSIKLMQYSIMPDHVHMLLFVHSRLADPLGNFIARLKNKINKETGAHARNLPGHELSARSNL